MSIHGLTLRNGDGRGPIDGLTPTISDEQLAAYIWDQAVASGPGALSTLEYFVGPRPDGVSLETAFKNLTGAGTPSLADQRTAAHAAIEADADREGYTAGAARDAFVTRARNLWEQRYSASLRNLLSALGFAGPAELPNPAAVGGVVEPAFRDGVRQSPPLLSRAPWVPRSSEGSPAWNDYDPTETRPAGGEHAPGSGAADAGVIR